MTTSDIGLLNVKYSLTNNTSKRKYKNDHTVYQKLTGVKKEYRGKRLGKILKADMALLIKENFPHFDYIATGNAISNEPMLRINREMGFKEVKRFETYKFNLEDLEKVIQKPNLKI